MDILEEYIYERGFHDLGDYFSNLIRDKRAEGKVAVMINDYTYSLLFTECDKRGYPKMRHLEYLTFMSYPTLNMSVEEFSPYISETTVYRKEIEIEYPMCLFKSGYDFMEQPWVFMWQGKIVNKQEVPPEKLDVKYLMKLAQEAVIKREGIILDDVSKNILIK
ncbi:MAG: hypothetical protein ACOX6V_05460 [Patescibacteria group bacterium]|jgi:hypothetical protein